MNHVETIQHGARLLTEMRQIWEESRRLCAESEALCIEAEQQREQSPWPHAALQPFVRVSEPPPEELAPMALVAIRALLNELPLAWQVVVVKQLVEQTLQKAPKRPIHVLSA